MLRAFAFLLGLAMLSPGCLKDCPSGTVTIDLNLPPGDHTLTIWVEGMFGSDYSMGPVTIPYPSGQQMFSIDLKDHPANARIGISYGDVNTTCYAMATFMMGCPHVKADCATDLGAPGSAPR